jgi:hypothetical protein
VAAGPDYGRGTDQGFHAGSGGRGGGGGQGAGAAAAAAGDFPARKPGEPTVTNVTRTRYIQFHLLDPWMII